MNILDRLKMELSNQQYFTDEQYTQFLTENDLTPTAEYVKSTMQKNLLFTVLDVLEAIANDTDIMATITTEYSTRGEAYKYVESRIQQVKDKIAAIPDEGDDYNCFSLMYTRNEPRNYSPAQYGSRVITNSEIDSYFNRR